MQQRSGEVKLARVVTKSLVVARRRKNPACSAFRCQFHQTLVKILERFVVYIKLGTIRLDAQGAELLRFALLGDGRSKTW